MNISKYTLLRIVTLLVGLTASSIALSSTIYTFTQVSSTAIGDFAPGTASGTIEFASPPSSSSGPWGSNDPNDVMQINVEMLFAISSNPTTILSSDFTDPYVLLASNVASNDGTELDAGLLKYDIPVLAGEPEFNFLFSDQPGQDRIQYATSLGAVSVFGDFQAVPVPAAAWLFGSALGLLGWVRRKTG